MPVKYGDNVIFGNVASLDWSKIQGESTGTGGGTEWGGNGPIYVGPDNQEVDGSNGMAIAGFVLSFIFPLLGLIFSIIGLNRAKQSPSRKGHGLAVAGIIISSVIMFVNLVIVLCLSLID